MSKLLIADPQEAELSSSSLTPENGQPLSAAAEDYTRDTAYTYGYSSDISPSWLRLAALNLSVPFPSRRPLRYLELGYGNGVSLNIHAAADPGEYWGTDFNPAHAHFARSLASASGANVTALDLSFADLVDLKELPDFDIITASGVWSWISEDNRALILELVRRKLARGGLFYLNYNAMPGNAAFAPLQRLLRLHSEQVNPSDNPYDRLDRAIGFLEAIAPASADGFFARTPKAADLLTAMRTQNPTYLIHEYFARNWLPCFFADLAARLAEAGLRFAGSSQFPEHEADWGVNAAGRAVLDSIDDRLLRETARDYLINRQYRCDIFVKGDDALAPERREEMLRDQLFLLTMPADEIELDAPAGEAGGTKRTALYHRMLDILGAEPIRPKSVDEIAAELGSSVDCNEVLRGLLFLTQLEAAYPAVPIVTDAARAACERLNQRIVDEVKKGRRIGALASPLTGTGIWVSPLHYALEEASASGARTPAELISKAIPRLAADQQPGDVRFAKRGASALEALRQAVIFAKSGRIFEVLELRKP